MMMMYYRNSRFENPILPRESRLLAASLASGRFSGRAKLEERARYGDNMALAQLRQALGFPSADEEYEEAALEAFSAAARRRGLPLEETEAFVALPRKDRIAWGYRHADDPMRGELARIIAPKEMEARDRVRRQRAERASGDDALARREPDYALRRRTREVFEELLDGRFRVARHSHVGEIHVVERGRENVRTEVRSVSAASVGLGRAYQKVSWSVAESHHTWHVSPEILSREVRRLNEAAPMGILYLREDLRAKQGQGTSINLQRRTPRGGWA